MFPASLQNGASRLVNPLQLRQMVQVFVGLAMERKYAEETIITRFVTNCSIAFGSIPAHAENFYKKLKFVDFQAMQV